MTTKDTTLCSGCHNNDYNHGLGGANGCWLLEKARQVTRTSVGVWQNPPYRWNPQETYHCNTPDGNRWITQDDPRIEEPT